MGEQALEQDVRHCRNCGARVLGEYCVDCGQREGRDDKRFLGMAAELTGDLFDIDSRFWRTLYPLIFRPGYLSAEFFAGRRARYLPPLRIYLVFSFLMFLAMGLSAGKNFDPDMVIHSEDEPATAEQLEEALEFVSEAERKRIVEAVEQARQREAEDPQEFGGLQLNLSGEDDPQWMQDFEKRLENNSRTLKDDPQRMVDAMLDYTPQMMFLLLPLFAALIQLMYLMSPYHYLQHMVFALHYHAFVYLLYMLEIGLEYALPSATGWLFAWGVLYLPLALRRAYGSGWGGAIGKSLFIYISYGVMFALGLSAVAVLALALL
ncbi:DUF3667 domain-containing protein [Mangrovimicrobium sediminis]|uniref:DUF3667 domain-containing protein n=1 Tax=Mangrovimicrobium sediminis TaxID=2562682 RepID=A0A4Z0LWI0_9GAMM|nr:DUF3667 domain-containing protein [Haliea sp. SAOS-164]TGD71763.1 DUF3667 domain-containing protein [Haliea sp. SAOS-164]